MMRFITIFLIFSFLNNSNGNLEGTYVYMKSKVAYSELTIESNDRFIYQSGVGGCQVEIRGTWELINKNEFRFINDEEFRLEYLLEENRKYLIEVEEEYKINGDSIAYELGKELAKVYPLYPNMNKGVWVKTYRGIKLKNRIEGSCFPFKGLHKKVN